MKTGVNRRIALDPDTALILRFWDRVAKSGKTECWNWTACFRNGYGAIKHRGKVHSAHRVAFILTYGEPAEDLVIAHKCDNKGCCNPAHLEAVTVKQNNKDARARLPVATVQGEFSPNSILTESDVKSIWELRKNGLGYRRISKELGLSKDAVDGVVRLKNWKHLIPDWV